MCDFNFNDDRNEKIEFIKKLGMIVFVIIIIFLIVRECNNYLTNKIREDINKDRSANIEKEQKDDIDLNKSFSYYNITKNDELHSFLRSIGKNLVPKPLINFIDYENETGFSINGYNWSAYDNLYEILDMLKSKAYRNVLKQLLYNKVNYAEAPLTEHFKEKFRNGFLSDSDSYSWKSYGFNKKYFVLIKYDGEAQDDYYFSFILDNDGYLDDIVLEKIVPMYDEEGIYIAKTDSRLMNNEEDIKFIIGEILFKEDLYAFEGDAGYDYKKDNQSRYNILKELGFTDRFRDYYNSLNGKGFVEEEVIYEDGDRMYIEDVNVKDKKAELRLEFYASKKVKYYDIIWTTDNQYRLDTFNVKFNREKKEYQ